MGNWSISMDKQGDLAKIYLSGSIDEDASFQEAPLAGLKEIDIFLEKVTSLNSCGVREWMTWMSHASEASVRLHGCPRVIVDQINMIHGFLPANSRVHSFFVRYYSEATEEETDILFEYGKHFTEGSVSPPAQVQDSKGNLMELDILPDKYFRFIKDQAS